MRVRQENNGLSALAVAGNHVVLLGWDAAEAVLREEGVLGFGILRERHEDGERRWLRGLKTFASLQEDPPPGVTVSSFWHPFQTFQWADYAVAPGRRYSYRIVAFGGKPGALVPRREIVLDVTTEPVDQGTHAVYFNRGAVASQEYARRFANRPPSEIGKAAYDWLSRGLVEGLEQLIARAGAGDELYGAFFEFKSSRIFQALARAEARGARVEILYDSDSQGEANEAAILGTPAQAWTRPREHSAGFAHNKFLVFRSAGSSREVWTGSTNLSENGMYGHSNNAHVVRDEAVAEKYFAYWKVLREDATKGPTSTACELLSAVPGGPGALETSPVFSPRKTLAALDAYADLARGADRALFATFAFGMNERFVRVYDREDSVLRFALMEKKGTGKTFRAQAAEIDRIRRHRNVIVSVGHKVELNALDRWLGEIDRITSDAHVLYVHTKYMLIDPLGAEPIVIVGSANFSAASTNENDENMLVIRGNPAVADVYLGEFMRLFSHYAFRESLEFVPRGGGAVPVRQRPLIENTGWLDGERPGQGYFVEGSARALRRKYFSGQ